MARRPSCHENRECISRGPCHATHYPARPPDRSSAGAIPSTLLLDAPESDEEYVIQRQSRNDEGLALGVLGNRRICVIKSLTKCVDEISSMTHPLTSRTHADAGLNRDHIARLGNLAVTVENKIHAAMRNVERLLLLVILLGVVLPGSMIRTFLQYSLTTITIDARLVELLQTVVVRHLEDGALRKGDSDSDGSATF